LAECGFSGGDATCDSNCRHLRRSESSKTQIPITKEVPSSKSQTNVRIPGHFWLLNIGISLELGAWNLVIRCMACAL
jgi:hypothetical protein